MIESFLGACRESCGCEQCQVTDRVLLVGEVNPLSTAPQYALYCRPDRCSGHRLQEKILGVDEHTYLSLWRTNLCVGRWSVKKARERARALWYANNAPWAVIVMLGAKVTDAFTGDWSIPMSAFSAKMVGQTQFVCLPHPSGLNRVWNRPDTVPTVRKLMSTVCLDLPWGQLCQ